MTDEKIFVHLPERKSEEVINLQLKIKELTMRLEEAEIYIDEQRTAINGLVMAVKHRKHVCIYDRETREKVEVDLGKAFSTRGEII